MPSYHNDPCKHGDLSCGRGFWDCPKCENDMNRAAYGRLTPEEKAYDDFVDPLGAYHSNFDNEQSDKGESEGGKNA